MKAGDKFRNFASVKLPPHLISPFWNRDAKMYLRHTKIFHSPFCFPFIHHFSITDNGSLQKIRQTEKTEM